MIKNKIFGNPERFKLSKIEGRQQQSLDLKKINQNMKAMSEFMMQMSHQVTELRNQQARHGKHHFDSQNDMQKQRMEKRFQDVNFYIPQLGQEQKEREDAILNWLAEVCKTVFSIGFNLYENGVLDINKVKAFCSENVLRNLAFFSQKNLLSPGEISLINNFLKEDLLPYYCQKYPESQQAETSAKFSSDLIARDGLESNDYDLVYKSKVQFNYEPSGNYNSQIMEFLNFIIQLPNKMIKLESKQGAKQEKPLNELFFAQMEGLFRMVEVENNTINMQKFNPKNPVEFEWTPDQSTEKQKQEYQQKVKSYTSFQIGQKISPNFKPFSKSQIQSGDLKLKSSEIMRVLTKWCEELENLYEGDSILKKQTYFRMKDGRKQYWQRAHFDDLVKSISIQKEKVVDRIKNQIQKNNHQHQSDFLNAKACQELSRLSENEATVGQFAAYNFLNNASYLVSYLNALLHGINLAIHETNEALGDKEQNLKYFPESITFKIGDLMRCKCSSREKEIIALYKEIERRHRDPNSGIKIIRVKNRLNKGNKDILLNLFYKEELVVEMQLAIKSDKSKFIECSYNFNHYLYELKRAQFGPIMEMCNIWINKDLKSKFYQEKIEKLNKRVKVKSIEEKEIYHQKIINCCGNNQRKITSPFRCSICKCFYSSSLKQEKNIECKKCKAFTCEMCLIEISDKYRLNCLKQFVKNKSQKLQKLQFLNRILDGKGGVILNLKSKKRKPLYFISKKHKNQYYLFEYNSSLNVVNLIEKFKSQKYPESFMKQNLIFTSSQINQLVEAQLKQSQDAISQYFITSYLKEGHKTERNTIFMYWQNMDYQTFQIEKIESWPNVLTINLEGNLNLDLGQLLNKFPNVQAAILNMMQIKQIPDGLWRNLKILEINHNSLKNLDFLNKSDKITQLSILYNPLQGLPSNCKNFQNLQKINLGGCNLKEFSKLFCDLPKLEQLELQHNHLQDLPEQVNQMVSLRKIFLQSNRLKEIPNSICHLKTLKHLIISGNYLQKLPQTFANLQSLKQLDISTNKFNEMPEILFKLKNLNILNISKCFLTQIPQQIEGLISLQVLVINQNQLNKLPESFGNLKNLKSLDIVQNNLSVLPESFLHLKSLKRLKMGLNNFQHLPQPFDQLQSLRYLALEKNQLVQLPKSLTNLKNLKTLKLQFNKISSLPQEFGNLDSLEKLYLSYNLIEKLPLSFGNLQSLTIFEIENNKLNCIQKQVYQLQNLQRLYYTKNQIKEIPLPLLELSNLELLKISILTSSFTFHPDSFSNNNKKLKLSITYLKKFKTIVENLEELASVRAKKLKLITFCEDHKQSINNQDDNFF